MSTTVNSRRVPLERRKRTEMSCDRCKSRKQKCHKPLGVGNCRYCQDRGIECITTQPRKQRVYGSVEGVGQRLSLLECLVKGLIPEADLSSVDEMRELGKSLGIPLPLPDDGLQADAKSSPAKLEDERVLQDQQGQAQYIGPSSSYVFQMKVRGTMGSDRNDKPREFHLFGRNPTDKISDTGQILVERSHSESGKVTELRAMSTPGTTPNHDYNSPMDELPTINNADMDALVGAFFDHVHPDYPVLHEASFREVYEDKSRSHNTVDRPWLCILLCVLILSRRVASVPISAEQEEKWWFHVQALLPSVLFTSSVSAVQALMLASLHLHNTNHRDACWTLTGAAVRIAFAIGLHRDGIETVQTPLTRELRKRIWWTLYAFEEIQVSSHDRPSAIEHAVSTAGCPREAILGTAGHAPPDYMLWANRLTVMLGSACRALRNASKSGAEETFLGPLSPAASLLRDLNRWKTSLPSHLALEIVDALPPSFQRPLLLLHIQYHYIIMFIARSALLSRVALLSKSPEEPISHSVLTMSDTCIESGRVSCQLLLKLEATGNFNAVTWWDVYYLYSSALIIVLNIICDVIKDGNASVGESRRLLKETAILATNQLKNPLMPGTMQRLATVVSELDIMADEFVKGVAERREPALLITSGSTGSTGASQIQTPGTAHSNPSSGPYDPSIPLNLKSSPSSSIDPNLTSNSGMAMTLMQTASPNPSEIHNTHHHHHLNDSTLPSLSSPRNHNAGLTPQAQQHQQQQQQNILPWTQLGYLDPDSSQFWQDVHWEDIQNMLLGDPGGVGQNGGRGGGEGSLGWDI